MQKLVAGLALLAGIAVGAGDAAADDRLDNGFYFGGQVGLVIPEDSDSSLEGESFDAEYDLGYDVGLVGGYDFGQNFRLEGEWSFRSYDVDTFDGFGTAFKGSGNADLHVLMANGYFDLPFKSHRFVPYIGVGVGLGILTADDVRVEGFSLIDDTDTVFAYQAMAGLSYDLTDEVTAGIEYRFLDTTDAFDSDIDSTTHNLMFNIRLRLD